jgi:hypothetical protein
MQKMKRSRITHETSTEMMEDSEQITKIIFAVCINMALIRKIKKIKRQISGDEDGRSSNPQFPSAKWLNGRVPACGPSGPGSIPACSKNFFRAIDGHSSD